MYKPVDVVEVVLWSSRIGAVTLNPLSGYYTFEYDKKWSDQGIELAPFYMPTKGYRSGQTFSFTDLSVDTFKRLPAMLSDSLPDKFGNALIDAAMAEQGVSKDKVTPLDRLAYMSNRAMGALEFRPPRGNGRKTATAIQLSLLVSGARKALAGSFDGDRETEIAIRNIIQVGISAGGARAKAVVAWNQETNEIKSGHQKIEDGFQHWLIKLDGVGNDLALGAGLHYGRIEYAYSNMAKSAGIQMAECRLMEENGRAHFMTKRFDREGNQKHHIQSLCAMRHLDFNMIGAHSYHQYFEAIRGLSLGDDAMQEGFRRMVFNVIASNNDDHTKNLSFIMKQGSPWALTPAYDMTFAFNPNNEWIRQHLMSVNGKFSDISRADLLSVATQNEIPYANQIIDEVSHAVSQWHLFADEAGLSMEEQGRIQVNFQPVARTAKFKST